MSHHHSGVECEKEAWEAQHKTQCVPAAAKALASLVRVIAKDEQLGKGGIESSEGQSEYIYIYMGR